MSLFDVSPSISTAAFPQSCPNLLRAPTLGFHESRNGLPDPRAERAGRAQPCSRCFVPGLITEHLFGSFHLILL